MANRVNFENSQEIGAFLKLTNAYCLISAESSESFKNAVSTNIDVPLIPMTIAGTKIIGRMCAGNKHGLLVPTSVTDEEWAVLSSSLPAGVKLQKVDEKLSALGNVISCNDRTALIHPDIDNETEEIIKDVLKVETYRTTIAGNPLVGSYCVFTNHGGLLHPMVGVAELDELSTLVQVPFCSGTVNRGQDQIGSGMVASDSKAFCGSDTTGAELQVIDTIFKLGQEKGKDFFASEDRDEMVNQLF